MWICKNKACLADLGAERYISVHHMMITGLPQCLIIATLLFCQNCGLPKSVEEEGGAQISKSNVTGEDEKTMLLQKSARSHQCCLLLCCKYATSMQQTLPALHFKRALIDVEERGHHILTDLEFSLTVCSSDNLLMIHI